MSSLNTERKTLDNWVSTDRAFATDASALGASTTGNQLIFNNTDNTTGTTDLATAPLDIRNAPMDTWTMADTNNINFEYDGRGHPWMCGKCHKLAFCVNSALNRFCSHEGWMVQLKAGMKIDRK